MRIFNHDIMACTAETLVGNHLYCGRVLGGTEANDIIQLHPDLKSEWDAIADHYNRIGLSHTEQVLWDVSFHHLAGHPEHEISVFYFGDAVHPDGIGNTLFRDLDAPWFEVVQWMNCKNNFMDLADELGVKVPHTLRFKDVSSLNPDILPLTYPCYFKPAVSVGGVGIVRCSDRQALMAAISQTDEDIPVQIQEEVKATTLLNVQYRATPCGPERLVTTDQVLDGFKHQGNRYPTPHDVWDLVEPMAEWMVERGMKEIFAFDVSVEDVAGVPRYLAIECNPRYNGASYPTCIALKLNLRYWSHETFNTNYRSLSQIDLSGLEFSEPAHTGIILVNWGTILVGKLGVLLVCPPETQAELKQQLKARLQ